MKKLILFFGLLLSMHTLQAQGTATIDKVFLQVSPVVGPPNQAEQKFFSRAVLYLNGNCHNQVMVFS